MKDPLGAEGRRQFMAGVRTTGTQIEGKVQAILTDAALEYVVNEKSLPGSPDLYVMRANAAIFVHGCFWHFHGCHLSKIPKQNADIWSNKLAANRLRDDRVRGTLLEMGTRVCVVWECALKGRKRLDSVHLKQLVLDWINGQAQYLDVASKG